MTIRISNKLIKQWVSKIFTSTGLEESKPKTLIWLLTSNLVILCPHFFSLLAHTSQLSRRFKTAPKHTVSYMPSVEASGLLSACTLECQFHQKHTLLREIKLQKPLTVIIIELWCKLTHICTGHNLIMGQTNLLLLHCTHTHACTYVHIELFSHPRHRRNLARAVFKPS